MTDNNQVCKNTFFRNGGAARFVNSEWGFSFSVWPPSFGFPISQEEDWKFPRQKQAEKPGGKLSYLSLFLPLSYIADRQTDRTEVFFPLTSFYGGWYWKMLFSFSRHRRERRIFFCSPCLPFPSRRLQRKEKKKYLLLPICAQADLRKKGGGIRHYLLHLRIFFSQTHLRFPFCTCSCFEILPPPSLLLFENKTILDLGADWKSKPPFADYNNCLSFPLPFSASVHNVLFSPHTESSADLLLLLLFSFLFVLISLISQSFFSCSCCSP